ncbi:dihydrodipicolinate synthase family protein [Amorphoplanes digitatis]|uniref:Dihydrodipicolinate synthase/N-acetylneuraminate lyase n=1 Tax=Actinoplanes digitatis TaxID=1868 RepID=A0A7W7MQE6_9ACTN|nr:dihydrodipicolinate synthase family protein [Actinoplanes digitatis]MBB4763146.1 dihydrodipicolinate synthase/N-acetylneuraminate lyase [Actinoplanes digitatis]GID91964.1 dihydrodipicolinate synthase family protein [Actinoplanes digitatis]
MTHPLWTGPAVALVNLFDRDGAVDAKRTAEHASRVVAAGIRGVLVNGSTGEAAALTDAERVELITAVREACPAVPVVAGASGDWWRPAAARVAAALGAGADAVLVAPPRLGGTLTDYYRRVCDAAVGAPVLAYHYPPVAGGPVPVDALTGLGVAGVKDSSGDPARLGHELGLGGQLAVYTGASALLGYASWLGAAGAIVAAANLVPDECLAAWDRDAAAQHAVLRAERESKALPGGLKEAMARRHGTSPVRRLG